VRSRDEQREHQARQGVRAERCNLTYSEMPGFDHEMRDASGISHLDEVLGRISAWLSARVTPPFADACAREGAPSAN
jgi:hypothetical protein